MPLSVLILLYLLYFNSVQCFESYIQYSCSGKISEKWWKIRGVMINWNQSYYFMLLGTQPFLTFDSQTFCIIIFIVIALLLYNMLGCIYSFPKFRFQLIYVFWILMANHFTRPSNFLWNKSLLDPSSLESLFN